MRRTIFLYMLLIIILMTIVEGFYSYQQSKNIYINESKKRLEVCINIIENYFKNYGLEYKMLNHFSNDDIRVTIIDKNGVVLFDSLYDRKKMENHKNREEIVEAYKNYGKIVYAIRYSKTANADYLYAAKYIMKIGVYIRTSLVLSDIAFLMKLSYEKTVKFIILCIIVGLIISLFISSLVTKPMKKLLEMITNNNNFPRQTYLDEVLIIEDVYKRTYNELKENINTIHQLNLKLNIILNAIDMGILFLDEKFRIVTYNSKAQEILEGRLKEGGAVLECIRNYELYKMVIRGNDYENIVLDNIIQNKIIEINIININENNKFIGILLVINDITRINKLEKIRTDFAANVTHELKTPLTSIKGFIETLKEGAIDDKEVANKFLDIIEEEVERLNRLIDDILYISELENDTICENNYITNFTDVLNNCVLLLSSKMIKKGIVYTYECIDDIFINIPPDKLKQIVFNLLDNAIIYNKENGKINIKTYEDKTQVYFEISDTGIGIPENEIERIFERFYRVDKGRSRDKGGTGLGLSIVKHIVNKYDGNIEVFSKLGEGTTFKISFKKRLS